MIGLAAAMMLADDGHEVTVVEQDAAPTPTDLDRAPEWARRGVAQFGLAHWLVARGSSIMARHLPEATALLAESGGYRFNLVKYLLGLQPGVEVLPEDDRFDILTGRRSAMEWAMARTAEEHPGIRVLRGEAIVGLLEGPAVAGGIPHVAGLRLRSGAELTGDLTIDATGRRSATPQWLEAIGATPPHERSEDSGFAYYGRYFKSSDGSMPPLMAPVLSPLGTFSVLTLPGDNGTWSITLYALSEDKELRRFRDPDVHRRVIEACPLHAHWLEAEPITEMASMVGVVDRHRRFVVDGAPCATGILSVGDASSCTNPSLGRGITLGLMHAEALRAMVADHFDDPIALAMAFDHTTEHDLRPWHDATTSIDRRRVEEMRALLAGDSWLPDPGAQVAGALVGAASSDPVAARAFGEVLGCLELPSTIFARPGLQQHLAELAKVNPPRPVPGPDREELLALVG